MRLSLPALAARPIRRLIHLSALVTRPLTMGVRAVILDEGVRVLLVRHSYVPGWHLPGGAVETGETCGHALVREVREECNIEVLGELALHGVFFNRQASRRDHVVVYLVPHYRRIGPRAPDWEIVETGFFDPRALPPGTGAATRARLAEILDGHAIPEHW